MAGTELNSFLRRLRSVLQRQEGADAPDADLLKRYVNQRDEAAFEALVQRHGPMVLGVCRRILLNPHDAEDAFQATFLVLVSRAANLRLHGTLGNWLYGVACRTAQHARHAAIKRRAKELAMPNRREMPEDDWAELLPLLDRELERLPEKYRAAIVLCELQGKPRREAAQLLGCPEGTVASRLSRGLALLAKRLAGHGPSVTSAVLAGVLSERATASVPVTMVSSTIRAATLFAAGQAAATGTISAKVAALTEGVLKTMLLSKLKVAAVAVLAMAAVGVGSGGFFYRIRAAEQPRTASPVERDNQTKSDGKQKPKSAPALTDKVEAAKAEMEHARAEVEVAEARLKVAQAVLRHLEEELSLAKAKQKKFVVMGSVVAADGKTPLRDVEVQASAGMGTLRRVGKTTTDKDGNFQLEFGPGFGMASGKSRSMAVVHVHKPGWYGWSYGWPAEFILTSEPLAEADRKQYPRYTNLTPGKPSRLIFRMERAASLKVSVVDGTGKPMANMRIWLTGERLPPATNVVADGHTNADGVFAVEDVPRNPYRLVIEDKIGGRGTLELGEIQFREAAEYTAVATIHAWGPQTTHISLKATRGRDR